MKFAGLSVGITKKKMFKIFCLISNDGSINGKLNQLRAVSFKDQPRVGFRCINRAIDYAQSLPFEDLTDYIKHDRLPSKGVHVNQEEYDGKYMYHMLNWNGQRWELPDNPQLEFNFVQELF